MKKNDVLRLEIVDITNLGFGVGRHEGQVVFVSDAVKGDVVRAKIILSDLPVLCLKNQSENSPTGSFSLYSFLSVILCLGVPKFMVFAVFVSHQFGMGALLDDSTFVEHGNLVAELAAG